jgi:ribosomal protein S1
MHVPLVSRCSSHGWENFAARHGVGDLVDGQISKMVPFGALIELTDGIPGLLVTEARHEAGSQVSMRIKDIDAQKQTREPHSRLIETAVHIPRSG